MKTYSFGDMLREFRNRVGLSQRALAEKANIDTSYISRIESGQRDFPSRPVALQLAEILQLSQEETDLWLISAGYISPRMQNLANAGIAQLMENISRLGLEELTD
jgi:transcriptional regulator with XRE-family HTH domain